MITHTINGVVRPRVAVARYAGADTRLDEAVVLRRCAMYRKAFRGTAISCPADALRFDAAASWIRERGVTVDVASAPDLALVQLAGVGAAHVVMHCRGDLSASSGRARFGRFVVDSGDQIATLASYSLAGTQHVVVDASRSDELAAEVLAHERVDLVGVHQRIGHCVESELADAVTAMIGKMAWITRRHAVVLSCVSLGDIAVPGADGVSARHPPSRRHHRPGRRGRLHPVPVSAAGSDGVAANGLSLSLCSKIAQDLAHKLRLGGQWHP